MCTLSNISTVALQEGNTSDLHCVLNHSGKFSPMMHWRIIDGQSAPINLEKTKYNEITTQTNVSLETTVTLNITSELNGTKFECWIEFLDPSSFYENLLPQSDSSCFSPILLVQSKLISIAYNYLHSKDLHSLYVVCKELLYLSCFRRAMSARSVVVRRRHSR